MTSVKIDDCCSGRNNNFNLIRLLAAYAVLWSHSYPIALGREAEDPLKSIIYRSAGTIAVDIFFISSGFLIYRSLVSNPDIFRYIKARVLRIYPALILATLATVFLVGPLTTTLSARDYFSDSSTWLYLLKNMTLVLGVEHRLPGVFEEVPLTRLVNASLWTLPYELTMYAILGVLFLVLYRIWRRTQPKIDQAISIFGIALLVVYVLFPYATEKNVFRLTVAFFAGAALFALRKHVRLDWRIAATLGMIALLAQPHQEIFDRVYMVSLVYLVIYLALASSGPLLEYNRLGDYSYGVYIYAFPIQQIVAGLYATPSVMQVTLVSSVLVLALAYVSWNLVEKRALSFVRKVS